MSEFYRMLPDGKKEPKPDVGPAPEEWLDLIELERDALIMRLRGYERILQKHGRLKASILRPVRER